MALSYYPCKILGEKLFPSALFKYWIKFLPGNNAHGLSTILAPG